MAAVLLGSVVDVRTLMLQPVDTIPLGSARPLSGRNSVCDDSWSAVWDSVAYSNQAEEAMLEEASSVLELGLELGPELHSTLWLMDHDHHETATTGICCDLAPKPVILGPEMASIDDWLGDADGSLEPALPEAHLDAGWRSIGSFRPYAGQLYAALSFFAVPVELGECVDRLIRFWVWELDRALEASLLQVCEVPYNFDDLMLQDPSVRPAMDNPETWGRS